MFAIISRIKHLQSSKLSPHIVHHSSFSLQPRAWLVSDSRTAVVWFENSCGVIASFKFYFYRKFGFLPTRNYFDTKDINNFRLYMAKTIMDAQDAPSTRPKISELVACCLWRGYCECEWATWIGRGDSTSCSVWSRRSGARGGALCCPIGMFIAWWSTSS
jgi:hypothetical protein